VCGITYGLRITSIEEFSNFRNFNSLFVYTKYTSNTAVRLYAWFSDVTAPRIFTMNGTAFFFHRGDISDSVSSAAGRRRSLLGEKVQSSNRYNNAAVKH